MSLELHKVRNELADAWHEAVVVNFDQWKKEPTRVLHTWTNFCVEFRRSTPYTMGHYDALAWPLKAIVIGLLLL